MRPDGGSLGRPPTGTLAVGNISSADEQAQAPTGTSTARLPPIVTPQSGASKPDSTWPEREAEGVALSKSSHLPQKPPLVPAPPSGARASGGRGGGARAMSQSTAEVSAVETDSVRQASTSSSVLNVSRHTPSAVTPTSPAASSFRAPAESTASKTSAVTTAGVVTASQSGSPSGKSELRVSSRPITSVPLQRGAATGGGVKPDAAGGLVLTSGASNIVSHIDVYARFSPALAHADLAESSIAEVCVVDNAESSHCLHTGARVLSSDAYTYI